MELFAYRVVYQMCRENVDEAVSARLLITLSSTVERTDGTRERLRLHCQQKDQFGGYITEGCNSAHHLRRKFSERVSTHVL